MTEVENEDFSNMTAEEAYAYACENGPCRLTRNIASKSPLHAVLYAAWLDRKPLQTTWKGAQAGGNKYKTYYLKFVE